MELRTERATVRGLAGAVPDGLRTARERIFDERSRQLDVIRVRVFVLGLGREVSLPIAEHGRDVAPRFLIRRQSSEACDGAATGVVGGERELRVVVEPIEERAQKAHAAANVLSRILRI